MDDQDRTKEQLLQDLGALRARVAALEQTQDEEQRRFADRLKALHEATNALTKAGSLDDLCELAIKIGRTRLGVDRLGIWFIGDDGATIVGAYGVDEKGEVRDERQARLTLRPGSDWARVLQGHRSSVLSRDVPLFDASRKEVGKGDQALAALWDGEDVIGCISADNLLSLRPITESDLQLLALYAITLGHLCSLKRAEEELWRHAEMFANLSEGVVLVRASDGVILDANARFAEMFGYAPGELKGKLLASLNATRDGQSLEQVHTAMAEGLAQNGTWHGEAQNVKKDGTAVWCLASVSAFKSSTVGRVWVGIYEDITERKEMEAELARHRDHLQELVGERTAQLEAAQQELVEKEKLAAVGNLVATVNHELRNPLTTIHTALYLLADRARGKGLGLEPLLDRAQKNVVRCEKIIEDLVDYTRIRELELQPTQVDRWLASVLDDHAVPKGVTLKRDLRSDAEVLVDRDRLLQCVVNLLNNACEAMGQAEPNDAANEIAVTTRADGFRLQIEIQDTGPGISPDLHDRILNPLFTTKSFGLGLGLPTVQDIMRQHGGGMDIESEAGRGTAATLWLPLPAS